MTEQYQQQQQVNLGHPEPPEVTSLHHKAFLIGPAPLHSGHQQQQQNHPPSSYLAQQQHHNYPQVATAAAGHSDAMTNGSSAVYGYDSPDCGYYEQECSGAEVGNPQPSYRSASCVMQMAVNSPVPVPIQPQQQQQTINNHHIGSDPYSPSPYHHQLQHHLGQHATVQHHFSANADELSADVIGKQKIKFVIY